MSNLVDGPKASSIAFQSETLPMVPCTAPYSESFWIVPWRWMPPEMMAISNEEPVMVPCRFPTPNSAVERPVLLTQIPPDPERKHDLRDLVEYLASLK